MTRRLRLLAAGALGVSLTLAAPAYASTTLGQTVAPTAPDGCSGFPDYDGFQEIKDGASAASRVSGVITSWRFLAGPTNASHLGLRIFRLGTDAETWQAVTDPTPLQAVPAGSGLHSYPSRVPLAVGDFIGVHSDAGGCFANVTTESQVRYKYEITPLATASATSFGFVRAVQDLEVTVEADADHDGYGDETQDLCPQSALTQAACPAPATGFKGEPKARAARTRIKLTSTVAGSTYTCSLDKKKATSCRAKVSYRCLEDGRHTLVAVATSPLGIADPTPATLKFRLARDRTGC